MTKLKDLRDGNVVGYLLMVYATEDAVRAINIRDNPKVRATIPDYDEILAVMKRDGLMEKGHLPEVNSLITWLTDLHLQLHRSPKFPYYSAAYYKALPFIVELRAKGASHDQPEVQTAVDALYEGAAMAATKGLSNETRMALTAIGEWLNMLAEFYKKDKEGTLELE